MGDARTGQAGLARAALLATLLAVLGACAGPRAGATVSTVSDVEVLAADDAGLSDAERAELDRLAGYAGDRLLATGGAALLGGALFALGAHNGAEIALGAVSGGAAASGLVMQSTAYGAFYDAHAAALDAGASPVEAAQAGAGAANAATRRAMQVGAEARRTALDALASDDAREAAIRDGRVRLTLLNGLAAAADADAAQAGIAADGLRRTKASEDAEDPEARDSAISATLGASAGAGRAAATLVAWRDALAAALMLAESQTEPPAEIRSGAQEAA